MDKEIFHSIVAYPELDRMGGKNDQARPVPYTVLLVIKTLSTDIQVRFN